MPQDAAGWHREDIKAAIRKRGVSLEQLSLDAGLSACACSMALLRPHFGAELAISELLGLSPRQIWPHRYDSDGAYRYPRSRKHHIENRLRRARQKGTPA